METATQTLHRLTSYEPGREWDEAIDDPRIVQDLEANDMSRLPWFVKRYPEPLPRTPLPRELRPGVPGSAGARILFTVEPPGTAVLLAAGMEGDWLRAWYTEAIANCRIRYRREQGPPR